MAALVSGLSTALLQCEELVAQIDEGRIAALTSKFEIEQTTVERQSLFDIANLTVLQRMFTEHVRMVERHPALAKIVFSDHLRLQFPSLEARFAEIHATYERRLIALLKRAKGQGLVPASLPPGDAATLFLCMIQGLAFQFAIARRPMQLRPEANQVFALYLRAIASPSLLNQPSGDRRRRSL